MLIDANVMGCSAARLDPSRDENAWDCNWLVPEVCVSAEAWQQVVPSALSKNVAACRLHRDDSQSWHLPVGAASGSPG